MLFNKLHKYKDHFEGKDIYKYQSIEESAYYPYDESFMEQDLSEITEAFLLNDLAYHNLEIQRLNLLKDEIEMHNDTVTESSIVTEGMFSGIKDTVNKLIEKIKNFFKKVWKWLRRTFGFGDDKGNEDYEKYTDVSEKIDEFSKRIKDDFDTNHVFFDDTMKKLNGAILDNKLRNKIGELHSKLKGSKEYKAFQELNEIYKYFNNKPLNTEIAIKNFINKVKETQTYDFISDKLGISETITHSKLFKLSSNYLNNSIVTDIEKRWGDFFGLIRESDGWVQDILNNKYTGDELINIGQNIFGFIKLSKETTTDTISGNRISYTIKPYIYEWENDISQTIKKLDIIKNMINDNPNGYTNNKKYIDGILQGFSMCIQILPNLVTDFNNIVKALKEASNKVIEQTVALLVMGMFEANTINESYSYCPRLGEDSILEETNIYKLNILFSKDDIFYNKEAFIDKKVNVVFVTGMSGAGKTTLSNQLAKQNNASLISLDDFDKWDKWSTYDKEQYPYTIEQYLINKFKSKKEYEDYIGISDKDYKKYYRAITEMCNWFVDHSNKNMRYIIEGIQIPIIFLLDSSLYSRSSIILKNTSLLTSFLRRIKRDKMNFIKNLPHYINLYFDWYVSQNEFRTQMYDVSSFLNY